MVQKVLVIKLESSYKVLTVHFNYKFDDSNKVCTVHVPPESLFFVDPRAAATASLQAYYNSKAEQYPIQNNIPSFSSFATTTIDSSTKSLMSSLQPRDTNQSIDKLSTSQKRLSLTALVPVRKTGQLYKQGRFIKTWKRRYMELDKGVLKYYGTSDVSDENKMKGSVFLAGYSVRIASDGKLLLSHSDREMLLYDSNDRSDQTIQEHEQWMRAIRAHIAYANELVILDPLAGGDIVNLTKKSGNLVTRQSQIDDSSLQKIQLFVGFVDSTSASILPKSKPSLRFQEGFNLAQLLIGPDPGFVIELMTTRGQKLYVNVCHHEKLGQIEKKIISQKQFTNIGRPRTQSGEIFRFTINCNYREKLINNLNVI